MDEWKNVPWKQIERNVFKLQKRIYRASEQNDRKKVHRLQRLLMKSRAGRLLAVRKVTQDNSGKKTAGIDGQKSLTPKQRMVLSQSLRVQDKASPLRRVEIPKPGTTETRKLGIPTIADRATQTLVKQALEPEWEARFEPNSYGFRPGRSCHDALEAIFGSVSKGAKWVLDADIAKCFDKIAHGPLLEKVQTSPTLHRQLRAWLRAGVMDHGELFPTPEGTPQGGCISPLLANIALHGLEEAIRNHLGPLRRGYRPPQVVRYADDFVVLHRDQSVILECQRRTGEWLKQMGLELKPQKTRVVHTLLRGDDGLGFDFLGFHIRQYPAGKTRSALTPRRQPLGFKTFIKPSKESIKRHLHKLKRTLRTHRTVDQETIIKLLRRQIVGWSQSFATCTCKQVFTRVDCVLFWMLFAWAKRRHGNKGSKWVGDKYWRVNDAQGWIFQPRGGDRPLPTHAQTPVRRHTKVIGRRSPYDGDWVYWSTRMGREPSTPATVAKLLKRQQGQCRECGLYFRASDAMEMDHVRPKAQGGTWALANLQLLHRHCHARKSARDRGTHDKRQSTEEPYDGKLSRPVVRPAKAGAFCGKPKGRPTGVKARSPEARMAGRSESKELKPIDTPIKRMGASHQAVTKVGSSAE